MPVDYLLKTEPSEYSFADLQKDKETVWEGVANPTAVMHMRAMKPGDRVIIYETGGVRSAVGTGTVVSADASDPKKPVVKIKAGQPIAKPIALERNQAQQALRQFSTGQDRQALRRSAHYRPIQIPRRRMSSGS